MSGDAITAPFLEAAHVIALLRRCRRRLCHLVGFLELLVELFLDRVLPRLLVFFKLRQGFIGLVLIDLFVLREFVAKLKT